MNCQQTGIHTIKPGDSMYLIAQMHRMTLPDLMAMNPGVDPYNLQIGSQIIICRDQEMNHNSMNMVPGMNQTPANMNQGSCMNHHAGNMDQGMNHHSMNRNPGMNQTPSNMGSGMNQTPSNMGSGMNQTPSNMGSGMNQTPSNMGSGMNQTPSNRNQGMNQMPTNMAPETNQNQMNMTPDMNQNQGGAANNQCVMQPATDRAIALNNSMRMVWEQHVYWTRMLINSIIAGMEDQAAVTARLMKNPSDMAGIFAEFYPSDVVSALETLLTEHLKIGGELTTEWSAGNMARANALNQQWYENADQIAASLSAANPYYHMEELQRMLYHHLELLTQEILKRMSRNYQEDIQAFDEVEQEALAMADYLTNGIIMQFSRDFR